MNESIGFTPFQLVFDHNVRGPLKVVKEAWLDENQSSTSLAAYVKCLRERLHNAWQVACGDLMAAQVKMMLQYDKANKVQNHEFNISDEVLVLLTVGGPLQSLYEGSYRVVEEVCHHVCSGYSRPAKEDSVGAC